MNKRGKRKKKNNREEKKKKSTSSPNADSDARSKLPRGAAGDVPTALLPRLLRAGPGASEEEEEEEESLEVKAPERSAQHPSPVGAAGREHPCAAGRLTARGCHGSGSIADRHFGSRTPARTPHRTQAAAAARLAGEGRPL